MDESFKRSEYEQLLNEGVNPLYFRNPGETAPPYPGEQREIIDPLYHVTPSEIIDVLQFISDDERKGIDILETVPHSSKREESCNNSMPLTSQNLLSGKRSESGRVHDSHIEKTCLCKLPDNDSSKEIEKKTEVISVNKEKADIIRAEESSATNFTVQPVYRQVFIDRKGEEVLDKSTIICIVHINQRPYRMVIHVKEIGQLSKLITQRFPDAILDYEEKKAEKAVEIKFRNAMRLCPVKTVYFEAGWQKISNRRIYLYDGLNMGDGIEVETGMTLPAFSRNANILLDIFQKSVSMYKEPMVIAVLFTFSLMGVLYRLFKEAGFPPHFMLFTYGKTGSMKTTISKIFFIQLCEHIYRDNVRRIDADTLTSLERAVIMAGYDTVTLIDDFSPAKTGTKKREMSDKLEMLIRMVGDGSSRSRSNFKLEDRRGEGVQGMVALTGELKGRGVSSNLRCFYCKMERGWVNEQMVSWFQEHPDAYTTLIAAFADFVGKNYPVIIRLIREKFNEGRKNLSNSLKERRLIDSAVTLRIAADIFNRFLLTCCQMQEKEAETTIKLMKEKIIECAKISEEMSTEESPSVTFVQAIFALMRTNQIVLNTDKVKMAEVSEYDGFEDGNFLYFNPDIIHKKVVAFLQQTNRYFPYEPKEVWSMLADDGIIKTASNGPGKRTYCVRIPVGNGTKHNFIKIRKVIFEAVCEGNYDCEKGERQ